MRRAGLIAGLSVVAAIGCRSIEVTQSADVQETERSEDRGLAEAIFLVENGQVNEGKILLQRLARSSSKTTRVEALRWLGHAHTKNFDPESALEAYEAALAQSPEDPWLHYATGTALYTIGDLETALSAYSKALVLDDAHLKALQWRGHVYTLLERYAEAVNDFERAIHVLTHSAPNALAEWGGDREAMLSWTREELARSTDLLRP